MKSTILLGLTLAGLAGLYQLNVYKARSSAGAWFQHIHTQEFEQEDEDDKDPFERNGFTVNKTQNPTYNAGGWRAPGLQPNSTVLYDPETNSTIKE